MQMIYVPFCHSVPKLFFGLQSDESKRSSGVESMRFNDRDRANKSSRKRIIAYTVKLCRRSTGFHREDRWRKEEGKEIKSARHSLRYVLARKGKRSWNKISGRPTTFAGKYARLGPFRESVIKKRSVSAPIDRDNTHPSL